MDNKEFSREEYLKEMIIKDIAGSIESSYNLEKEYAEEDGEDFEEEFNIKDFKSTEYRNRKSSFFNNPSSWAAELCEIIASQIGTATNMQRTKIDNEQVHAYEKIFIAAWYLFVATTDVK